MKSRSFLPHSFLPDDQLPGVSGGKDNPPDRYVVVDIGKTGSSINEQEAATLLNEYSDKGFRIVAFSEGRVILGNYKENK